MYKYPLQEFLCRLYAARERKEVIFVYVSPLDLPICKNQSLPGCYTVLLFECLAGSCNKIRNANIFLHYNFCFIKIILIKNLYHDVYNKTGPCRPGLAIIDCEKNAYVVIYFAGPVKSLHRRPFWQNYYRIKADNPGHCYTASLYYRLLPKRLCHTAAQQVHF